LRRSHITASLVGEVACSAWETSAKVVSISTSPTRFPALSSRTVFCEGAGEGSLALGFCGRRGRAGDMASIFRRTHSRLAGLGRKSALVDALGNIA